VTQYQNNIRNTLANSYQFFCILMYPLSLKHITFSPLLVSHNAVCDDDIADTNETVDGDVS